MYVVYYDKDGTASTLPFDPVEAKRTRSKTYLGDMCMECETREKYTKNGNCVKCSMLNANDLFCFAAGVMTFEYSSTDIPPLAVYKSTVMFGKERKYIKDRVVTWEHEKMVRELSSMVSVPGVGMAKTAKDAINLGLNRFVLPIACETLGHYGIRTLENRCHFCEEDRLLPSPRKAALVAGNVWYTPEKPCPYCGTRADRRVYDGRCSGCIPTTTGSKNATTIMMENAPDMIISRGDARRMQLKVFRTGEPCRRGHRGFRWTSTGNCIPCAKGER